MAMNKMLIRLALLMLLALVAGCSPAAVAAPQSNQPATTCASEGYTGAKLTWCVKICESGLTGKALDDWIHRWIRQYRQLPYCAVTP